VYKVGKCAQEDMYGWCVSVNMVQVGSFFFLFLNPLQPCFNYNNACSLDNELCTPPPLAPMV